jgi:hypothetical protein
MPQHAWRAFQTRTCWQEGRQDILGVPPTVTSCMPVLRWINQHCSFTLTGHCHCLATKKVNTAHS